MVEKRSICQKKSSSVSEWPFNLKVSQQVEQVLTSFDSCLNFDNHLNLENYFNFLYRVSIRESTAI